MIICFNLWGKYFKIKIIVKSEDVGIICTVASFQADLNTNVKDDSGSFYGVSSTYVLYNTYSMI